MGRDFLQGTSRKERRLKGTGSFCEDQKKLSSAQKRSNQKLVDDLATKTQEGHDLLSIRQWDYISTSTSLGLPSLVSMIISGMESNFSRDVFLQGIICHLR